jgi:hypothetical protein
LFSVPNSICGSCKAVSINFGSLPSPLLPLLPVFGGCNGSKQFEIDWGSYQVKMHRLIADKSPVKKSPAKKANTWNQAKHALAWGLDYGSYMNAGCFSFFLFCKMIHCEMVH